MLMTDRGGRALICIPIFAAFPSERSFGHCAGASTHLRLTGAINRLVAERSAAAVVVHQAGSPSSQ